MDTRARKRIVRVSAAVLALALLIVLLLRGDLRTSLKPVTRAAEAPVVIKPVLTAAHLSPDDVVKRRQRVPLMFEANVGQTNKEAKYLCRNSSFTMFLTDAGPVFSLYSRKDPPKPNLGPVRNPLDSVPQPYQVTRMDMRWRDATGPSKIYGTDKQITKSNYFIGKNPDNWHTEIPNYKTIVYENVYPGIDVNYNGEVGTVEYSVTVKPGADASLAGFDLFGIDRALTDKDGNLLIARRQHVVRHTKPVAYLEDDNRREVPVEFTVEGRHVGFKVGAYDHSKTLVIDPQMAFATFLSDEGAAGLPFMVTDPATLLTWTNFNQQSGQAGVPGTGVPGGVDRGYAVAVDSTGVVYATGETNSPDFPIKSVIDGNKFIGGALLPPDPNYEGALLGHPGSYDYTGNPDSYVLSLSPDGSTLLFSSYFGGFGSDSGRGIAVDGAGNVYFTGIAGDGTFPLKNERFVYSGGFDGFLVKLAPGGQNVLFSTCFGGSIDDIPTGIAIDSVGGISISGTTTSPDFAIINAVPTPTYVFPKTSLLNYPPGAPSAGFVIKFTSIGRDVVFAAYIGGPPNGTTTANGIAVDSNQNVYVCGSTDGLSTATMIPPNSPAGPGGIPAAFSPDLLVSSLQPQEAGGVDGYLIKYSFDGSSIIYSTYFGGTGNDSLNGIAVDAASRVFAVGSTNTLAAGNSPPGGYNVLPPVIQENPNASQTKFGGGASDGFYILLENSGGVLNTFTYIGGSAADSADAIATDAAGYAYITGFTGSSDLPLTQGIQAGYGGGASDAFAAKYNPAGNHIYTSYLGSSGTDFGHGVAAGAVGTSTEGFAYVTGESGAPDGPFGTLNAFQRTGGFSSPDAFVACISDSSPRITSSLFLSILLGQSVNYTITATNFPDSYAATGLPTGLSAGTTVPFTTPKTGTVIGTPVSAGRYQITLQATNVSGTGAAFLILAVNSGIPVFTQPLSLGPDLVGVSSNPVSLVFRAPNNQNPQTPPADPSQNPTSFGATGLPAGLVCDPNTGVISGTPLVAGVFNVQGSATNNIGTGFTNIAQLTVNPNPPTIQGSSVASGTVGAVFTYNIQATNNPNSYTIGAPPLPPIPPSQAIPGAPGLVLNTTTGVISGIPTAIGATMVSLVASNGGGNSNPPFVLTITINDIPVITSPSSVQGTLNVLFPGYQITALNNPSSFNANGLPPGLSINAAGLISGTPGPLPSAAGTYTVTLLATNATGTGTASLQIVINPGPPNITSSLNIAGTVGVPLVPYKLTATNNPSSFSVTNLPPGLTLDSTTGIISGTPTQVGTFTITLNATNGAGTGPNSTLTVTILSAPPHITSPLTASGSVGSGFNYVITATGSTPITFNATGLPPGLGFNPTSATISGVPTAEGTYVVVLTATNLLSTDTELLIVSIGNFISALNELDSDGDGFPDNLEKGVGTDPLSFTSTPFGGAPAGQKRVCNISSMQVKLNFSKTGAGKDSIMAKGTIPVPSGFSDKNVKNIVVYVSGITRQFAGGALNAPTKGESFKLKLTNSPDPSNAPFDLLAKPTKKPKSTNALTCSFQFKLLDNVATINNANGTQQYLNFQTALGLGIPGSNGPALLNGIPSAADPTKLVSTTSPVARTLDVIILLEDIKGFYQSAKIVQYTVSVNKNGTAVVGK